MMGILYVVLGLLMLYMFLRRDTGKHKLIPGPQGWPLIGYAPYMTKGKVHEIFLDLAGKYGDIFKLNMFGQTIIVLNTAKLIRAAFSGDKYKKHMNDRPPTFYGEQMLWGSQTIGFVGKPYGSFHGDLRKIFAKGMHIYGEGRKEFEDKVNTELANLVDILKCCEGTHFNMVSVLRRSLTNVLSIILGGHTLKDDDKDVNMFWDYAEWGDFFLDSEVDFKLKSLPFLRFVPGAYRSAFKKIQQGKQTILKRYFYDKKATHTPGEVGSLVDFLLEEQLAAKKDGQDIVLTDVKIMAMILETINAGLLTSLSSLSNVFLCLMNYPDCQRKIQAELDRVIGTDRLPTLADKEECVFTEAVILEGQRYITTAPLSLPHLCSEGMEFEGYDIPANSVIFSNVWFVNHNSKIWGDPWTFRPERWLDEGGGLLQNNHILRSNWLAFSTGRRQCPGEDLARSRIFLYLATLLQRWNFEMPPGHSVACDPRLDQFDFNVTSRSKPYICRVTPRTKAFPVIEHILSM